MKPLLISVGVAASLALHPATPLQGQSLGELIQAVQQGGGWITLPIEEGQGLIETGTWPTAGMRFNGCMQVWRGHSGTWEIEASDLLGDGHLDVTTSPGEPVEFSYHAGLQAQLKVDVTWSEPRDTTLFMWVGLEALAGADGDPCEPEGG